MRYIFKMKIAIAGSRYVGLSNRILLDDLRGGGVEKVYTRALFGKD